MAMVSISGSPFFPVMRVRMGKFSHIQNRALKTMLRPTEAAVAIATMQFNDWRTALHAARKEELERRRS
jgi:hypothetical protein